MTWQTITDNSPPWDGVPVLVWREGDSVWISGRKKTPYSGMNHDWYLGGHHSHPTHWMPVPEPPNPTKIDSQRFPDLSPVILWLEAGCDPMEAAKELRIYQSMMGREPPAAQSRHIPPKSPETRS